MSDLLSVLLIFVYPVQLGVDLATGGLLFLLLGRNWQILPALVAEAIPGLSLFPFWVPVVASICLWGTVRGQRPLDFGGSGRPGTEPAGTGPRPQ